MAGTEVLQAMATETGLMLSTRQKGQLHHYVQLLEHWSLRTRLVSRGDREHIWERHILDSLSVVPQIRQDGLILDLGSGAGLPGIPVAIVLQERDVLLAEPSRMKALFLSHAVQEIALGNVKVERERVEVLATPNRYGQRVGVVVARAVAGLPQLWEYAQPLLRPDGVLVAMKGPKPLGEFPDGVPPDIECSVEEITLPLTGRTRSFVTISKTG